jgi:hypothetical protein
VLHIYFSRRKSVGRAAFFSGAWSKKKSSGESRVARGIGHRADHLYPAFHIPTYIDIEEFRAFRCLSYQMSSIQLIVGVK